MAVRRKRKSSDDAPAQLDGEKAPIEPELKIPEPAPAEKISKSLPNLTRNQIASKRGAAVAAKMVP